MAYVNIGIRLAGPLEVTAGATRFEPGDFPGRQGRIVFAALAFSGRPVDRNELADILWPNRLPASWTRDLSAVISKLRALLAGVADVATGGGRWYALELPADAQDRCRDGAPRGRARRAGSSRRRRRAARCARRRRPRRCSRSRSSRATSARGSTSAARSCARCCSRALVVRAEVLCDASSPAAIAAAQALVDLEPEREQAHVLLMRAHLSVGDRVEALRNYERLRKMLADDFGLLPSDAADELMRDRARRRRRRRTGDALARPLPATVDDARRTRIFGRDAELAPARCTLGRRRGRAPRPRGRPGRNRQESAGLRSGGARVRTRLHRHLRSVSRRPGHSVRRDRRRVHRGPAHTGCRRSLRASRRRRHRSPRGARRRR